MKTTNILFCGDAHIRDGILLSCLSLLQHTSGELNIYLLTATVQTDERTYYPLPEGFSEHLRRIVTEKNSRNTVTRLDISDLFRAYPPTANLHTRFTPLCMLRLFADAVPEIPNKILYLDADVVCQRDFTAFYEQDLTDTDMVGVPDRYGKWFFSRPFWAHNYLNSGVLLLNMERIRQNGLFEKCRRLCCDKPMFMPDQTALNQLAVKRKVSTRYNNQSRLNHHTVFKHFTTFFRLFPYIHPVTVKPWEPDKLHRELRLYELDELLEIFQKEKQQYESGNPHLFHH